MGGEICLSDSTSSEKMINREEDLCSSVWGFCWGILSGLTVRSWGRTVMVRMEHPFFGFLVQAALFEGDHAREDHVVLSRAYFSCHTELDLSLINSRRRSKRCFVGHLACMWHHAFLGMRRLNVS